jgi:hypothetical protein
MPGNDHDGAAKLVQKNCGVSPCSSISEAVSFGSGSTPGASAAIEALKKALDSSEGTMQEHESARLRLAELRREKEEADKERRDWDNRWGEHSNPYFTRW